MLKKSGNIINVFGAHSKGAASNSAAKPLNESILMASVINATIWAKATMVGKFHSVHKKLL